LRFLLTSSARLVSNRMANARASLPTVALRSFANSLGAQGDETVSDEQSRQYAIETEACDAGSSIAQNH